MKRAVSISIGSSKRDKIVDITILGETVRLERIGTNGDLRKAAQLYEALDGKVDALGVGGGVLGIMVGERWYEMHSLKSMIRGVRHTPVVDGTGLKMTLERRAVHQIDRELVSLLQNRTALVVSAVDRWGMAQGVLDLDYKVIFGDLPYSLGLPIPLYSGQSIKRLTALLAPAITRLPFRWVYPVGKAQEHRHPMHVQFFQQAGMILGDCHYIWKYMPDRLDGKVIVTNTTTREDVETFRRSGARYLVTTTPVYDGRSFGTNLLEAAIIAAAGRKEPVDYGHPGDYFDWMNKMIDTLELAPQIQELSCQETVP